jgi:tetratricopeptide (TPR) repeat protein
MGDKPAPYEIEAVTYCAESLYQLKRYDDAINMAKLLKKIEPCNIKAYYVKGLSLAHKKNFAKAIDEMGDGLNCLQTNPNQVSTYNYVDYSFSNWSSQMGMVFNLKGDYEKSAICYKSALEHDPTNVVLQRNYLKQLYASGKKFEFTQLYNKWKTPDMPQRMITEMMIL